MTNTQGESSLPLVRALAKAGAKQNVTALITLAQVRDVSAALGYGPSACISAFAGRVADTGRDPEPIVAAAVQMLAMYPQLELIWVSPRELLNIFPSMGIRSAHRSSRSRTTCSRNSPWSARTSTNTRLIP